MFFPGISPPEYRLQADVSRRSPQGEGGSTQGASAPFSIPTQTISHPNATAPLRHYVWFRIMVARLPESGKLIRNRFGRNRPCGRGALVGAAVGFGVFIGDW